MFWPLKFLGACRVPRLGDLGARPLNNGLDPLKKGLDPLKKGLDPLNKGLGPTGLWLFSTLLSTCAIAGPEKTILDLLVA